MSFTTKIKEELTTISLEDVESLSLLSGFVRNNATYINDNFVLTSENQKVITYLCSLIDRLEDVQYEITITSSNNFSKNNLYVIRIAKGLERFLSLLAYQAEVVPSYMVEDEMEIRNYLKGVFLSSGSVNDPKTSRYHMELTILYPEEAVFVQKLLNKFSLNAKILSRDRGYMVYLKEAESISDFLKLMGAMDAVLYYEEVRIYRDKKNETNRLNNCEQANMDKIFKTAKEQLEYIKTIRENDAFDLLDEKTKEAIFYREKYKEASLNELSEIISLETNHKITKSGLNHRFRKIKELALKLTEN